MIGECFEEVLPALLATRTSRSSNIRTGKNVILTSSIAQTVVVVVVVVIIIIIIISFYLPVLNQ